MELLLYSWSEILHFYQLITWISQSLSRQRNCLVCWVFKQLILNARLIRTLATHSPGPAINLTFSVAAATTVSGAEGVAFACQLCEKPLWHPTQNRYQILKSLGSHATQFNEISARKVSIYPNIIIKVILYSILLHLT